MIKRIFFHCDSKGYLNILNDTIYLKILYYLKIGKKLNLNNPKSFNEKIQWLKLNDHNPDYTIMVDKYAVREYISKKIGSKYLIPLIGSYDNFNQIDINKLPDKFVIKCNHDSGGVFICDDKEKFDFKEAKKKIEYKLKRNYFYSGREWPYKNVIPKIVVEEYIGKDIIDYKVMCFNGKPEIIFTCSERHSEGLKVTFFDLDWNRLPFSRHYPSSTKSIAKPQNLMTMIELSKKLAKDIPFVRVDWYEENGNLYFGELTFYPGSGLEEFNPDEWDNKLGDLIDLSVVKENNNEKKNGHN